MKIKTITLQDMLNKAVKGASNNKIIPITGLISVEVKDKILTLTSTDANNYLKIFKEVDTEDFEAVVPINIFSKLIEKISTKEIELVIKDQVLEVKGNGVYKIPLPLDEEGSAIHFPERVLDMKKKVTSVKVSEKIIKSVLEANKPAVAVTVEIPFITGYYFDAEKVLSTNSFVICVNREKVFKKPILLPADFVELLPVIGTKEMEIFISEKNVFASSSLGSVYGYILEGIENFPEDVINENLGIDFQFSAKVKKELLMKALSRLELFVDDYDKNAIDINFNKDGLEFSCKKLTGVEFVPYEESIEDGVYELIIDIALLTAQLNGHSEDIIEIHYGSDRAIKISSGKVTHLIALFEGE